MWSDDYLQFADKLTASEKASYNCSSKVQAVYIDKNGRFIYTQQKKRFGLHVKFICTGKGVIRTNEFEITYSDTFQIINNQKSDYDFVIASCTNNLYIKYTYYLSGVSKQNDINKRPIPLHKDTKKKAMNILIIGYDSTSQLAMQRNLPKSVSYMENTLGGIRLKDYNIVGDGTPQALFPILTGQNEAELPESRRTKSNKVKDMDEFPFIWKKLREKGYVTQWAEDGHKFGTFTYRMVGFNKQPVDHYMRNYYLSLYSIAKCQGNKNTAELMLEWGESLFEVYPDRPKFSFLFHSEYTHNSMGTLAVADDGLSSLLKRLHTSGKLDNTILITMADHGNRYTTFRQTIQGFYSHNKRGKIEERTPYMAIRFPDWFRERYPVAMKALKENSNVLTTPYDIHETLLDALDYNLDNEMRGIQKNSKIETLLRKINETRDCESAEIEAHWCGCLDWRKEKTNSTEIIRVSNFIVSFLDKMTNDLREYCNELTLLKIKYAVSHKPKDNLLKFDQTNDVDGRIGHIADKISVNSNIRIYQITLITSPNNGVYESSVTYSYSTDTFTILESQISRINKYGNQPNCIAEKFPNLRKYCFCKD